MASKKDYIRAVETIVRIDKALTAMELFNKYAAGSLGARNDVIGIITAQMALAFAEDAKTFDSWEFNDAVQAARKKAFTLP